jgi:hypothetical protein
MYENRFSELFPQDRQAPVDFTGSLPEQNVLPVVSLESIYQSAAARARNDHELDRLFNPEFYGDSGSGI